MDSEQSVIFTKWGYKWLKFGFNMVVGNTPERVHARGLLAAFDACEEEPASHLVRNTVTFKKVEEECDGSQKTVIDNVKKTLHIKKGKRTSFAMALAKKAYVKFGARQVTEANVLVTRKWLNKLIEDEFKDLRTCDKALALDRATFLSFIPTMAWNNYKFVFHGDNAVTDRIGGNSLFSKIAHIVGVPAK